MNPVLAQIYGTGFEKAASADEELDLNNISAAQLLELLEEGEKTASEDELDLSQLTGAELLQILDEADAYESEKTASAIFEKMANDGSFDFYDAAGRIMAHAYADEFSKLASAEDDVIEVDLDSISGDDLLELMEMGYEFGDAEKTASWKSILGYTPKGKGFGSKAWQALKDTASGKGYRKGREIMRKGDKKLDAAAKARAMAQQRDRGMSDSGRALAGELAGKRTREGEKLRSQGKRVAMRGALNTAALYGTGAAGTGLAGYGGYRAMKRKK